MDYQALNLALGLLTVSQAPNRPRSPYQALKRVIWCLGRCLENKRFRVRERVRVRVRDRVRARVGVRVRVTVSEPSPMVVVVMVTYAHT